MQERAANAFFFSVLLHGIVVASLLSLAFVVQRHRPQPVIFELVAGPPTDPMATEAPALGSPDGGTSVKVKIPRVVHRAAPQPEARSTAEERATAARPESKMSYDEYVKRFGRPAPPRSGAGGAPRPIATPRINSKGIAEGVLGGSPNSRGGGGGRALSAAQRSALDADVARLVTALRQNHQKPPGLSDLLAADIEFLVAADGTLTHVRVSRSSGNADFDQSCVQAFQQVGSVGPKPDGKSSTWVLTFRMKDE
jgi:TonB family protein